MPAKKKPPLKIVAARRQLRLDVDPETRLLIRQAAAKLDVSAAEFCRRAVRWAADDILYGKARPQ